MTIMKSGDNQQRGSTVLVHSGLEVTLLVSCTVCGIGRGELSRGRTSARSEAVSTHGCTRRVSASCEDGSAVSCVASGEGAAQGCPQAQQPR